MGILNGILPDKPYSIKPIEWKAAKIGHITLYVFLLVMPVTGIMSALNVPFFDDIHASIAILFLILISGHILFVIKHLFYDIENLLKRII